MGIIRATIDSIGGSFNEQFAEAIRPIDLSKGVIFTKGGKIRQGDKRDNNYKGASDVITNGSLIHVPENTCMLLVDNGAMVGVSSEPGNYQVSNSSAPSIFGDNLWDTVKHTFTRFKFSGIEPSMQEVFYVNLQEITDIKFGTPTPVMYYDSNYDMDLEVMIHGAYSIKIRDPILFYKEFVPKSATKITVENLSEQLKAEFLDGLQTAIGMLSTDGIRISQLSSKTTEVSQKMSDVLDAKWLEIRGLEVLSAAIQGIRYTEESQKILTIRNQGSALSDAKIRQGYVQGAMARGFEAAGSNEAGATNAFLGMGFGMNAGGGMFGEIVKSNQDEINSQRNPQTQQQAQPSAQPQQNSVSSWSCPECSNVNTGKFCSNCGAKKPEVEAGGFCGNCGSKLSVPRPKFCPECGQKTE